MARFDRALEYGWRPYASAVAWHPASKNLLHLGPQHTGEQKQRPIRQNDSRQCRLSLLAVCRRLRLNRKGSRPKRVKKKPTKTNFICSFCDASIITYSTTSNVIQRFKYYVNTIECQAFIKAG